MIERNSNINRKDGLFKSLLQLLLRLGAHHVKIHKWGHVFLPLAPSRHKAMGVRYIPLKRTALKHVYYLGWNRSPAQVGCMRQALRPGALGRPRGSGWRGRWEGGSGWGTHVNPWLFHFNVWQNSLQIKNNNNKNKKIIYWSNAVILKNKNSTHSRNKQKYVILLLTSIGYEFYATDLQQRKIKRVGEIRWFIKKWQLCTYSE